MIGTTVLHYRILQKLGEGGMGVVYKARDTKLERAVAIKFLPRQIAASDEERQRFKVEARAAAALNHPNIATIYAIEEHEDELFIVMEYIEGRELREEIRENNFTKPQRFGKVLDIATQIAAGLQAAHEKGVVHRDIKSANIMITEKGQVKIMDFGLAKMRGGAQLTKDHSTLGTAAYMSPEQARGEETDHRTDIWAFGVVLYEILTGQLPFRGDYEQAVIYSILNEEPEPLTNLRTELPVELEQIVNKALAKNPDERYQQVDEMLADLNSLGMGQPSGVSQTHASRVGVGFKPTPTRKPFYAGIAGVSFLAILALFIFYTSKPDSVDNKSIAVLPFTNLSEDKSNEFFSDGLTEDIIAQLSKIGDLKVISRTSAMRYKNSEKSLEEIAEDLGVSTILEGSVRRAGDQVRIVAQLIDAKTDHHLWAETYDRELKDIFAIQSDIAQNIAAALEATLSSAEKERIEKRPTANLTAYDYYLKGRDLYYRYQKQANENGIDLFQKAIELDPDFALAYAGLGDAFAQRAGRFGFSSIWLDSAISVSKKAIVIDPNLAEGYKALGLAYLFKGWSQKALELNEKALELNPNYHTAVANKGFSLLLIGRLDEALPMTKKGFILDPTNAASSRAVGTAYMYLDNFAKAEDWFKRALELQPDNNFANINLIQLYLINEKMEQAIELSRKTLSLLPGDINVLQAAGYVELFTGNYTQAQEYFEKAKTMKATRILLVLGISVETLLGYTCWKTDRHEQAMALFNQSSKTLQQTLAQGYEIYDVPYELAVIHAIQGNKEEAYRWLRKALEAGFRLYRSALSDPLLENLREDEAFQQMMSQVKAKVDEMRNRVEEE